MIQIRKNGGDIKTRDRHSKNQSELPQFLYLLKKITKNKANITRLMIANFGSRFDTIELAKTMEKSTISVDHNQLKVHK
jgi:hypothetical protein